MHDCRIVLLAMTSASIVACGSQPSAALLEENKALVRQWVQDIDESDGSAPAHLSPTFSEP